MDTAAPGQQPEVKPQYVEPYPAVPAYRFNPAPDQVGLALEHPDYRKPSHRACLGRGFIRVLPGDGYSTTETEEDGSRKKLRAELIACACVHRGYTRVRHAFGRAVMAVLPTYLAMEEPTTPEAEALTDEEKDKLIEEAQKRLLEATQAANADVLEQHFSHFKGVAPAADAA